MAWTTHRHGDAPRVSEVPESLASPVHKLAAEGKVLHAIDEVGYTYEAPNMDSKHKSNLIRRMWKTHERNEMKKSKKSKASTATSSEDEKLSHLQRSNTWDKLQIVFHTKTNKHATEAIKIGMAMYIDFNTTEDHNVAQLAERLWKKYLKKTPSQTELMSSLNTLDMLQYRAWRKGPVNAIAQNHKSASYARLLFKSGDSKLKRYRWLNVIEMYKLQRKNAKYQRMSTLPRSVSKKLSKKQSPDTVKRSALAATAVALHISTHGVYFILTELVTAASEFFPTDEIVKSWKRYFAYLAQETDPLMKAYNEFDYVAAKVNTAINNKHVMHEHGTKDNQMQTTMYKIAVWDEQILDHLARNIEVLHKYTSDHANVRQSFMRLWEQMSKKTEKITPYSKVIRELPSHPMRAAIDLFAMYLGKLSGEVSTYGLKKAGHEIKRRVPDKIKKLIEELKEAEANQLKGQSEVVLVPDDDHVRLATNMYVQEYVKLRTHVELLMKKDPKIAGRQTLNARIREIERQLHKYGAMEDTEDIQARIKDKQEDAVKKQLGELSDNLARRAANNMKNEQIGAAKEKFRRATRRLLKVGSNKHLPPTLHYPPGLLLVRT